jgi:hypothetical protein
MLGSTAAAQAHGLTAALIGHTLDTTGMAVERQGLFGKGWVPLLCGMGLNEPKALDTLVSVSEVLQGQDGVFSIWRAFTALMDTPEAAIADLTHCSHFRDSYHEWAAEIREALLAMGVKEDAPFRLLAGMAARGMTKDDTETFVMYVQGWRELMATGDIDDRQDAVEWAGCLEDVIVGAAEIIAEGRRHRSMQQIKARELARADAKATAMDFFYLHIYSFFQIKNKTQYQII